MSELSREAESRSDDSRDRAFLAKYQGNPAYFGNPDGARADLRDFIELADVHWRGMDRSFNASVRAVIGPKGSGKTLYLRKLTARLRENPSLVLSDATQVVIHESPPTRLLLSDHVVKVGTLFTESSLTEIWQLLWGRSIISAAATHLAFHKDLRGHLRPEDRQALLSDFSHLLGRRVAAPRSPLTALKALIDRFDKAQGLAKHLNDASWDDLEDRVTDILADCPPLVFVIDAIDDDFGHAPNYWARCQKGLFYETMRLLRSRSIGSRLLVLISLRDIVYHAVFRSEHASRYVGDPHLRLLEWGYGSAKALLDEKTARVPAAVMRDRPRSSFTDWLGFSEVRNSYGKTESVYRYALRHTQCLPRDIVNLGNLLGLAWDRARDSSGLTPELFRAVVSDVATLSGHVQIGVAANQVVADEIPAEAVRYGFLPSYLSVDEYRSDRADAIKEIISSCGSLRFGRREFRLLQEAGRDRFAAPDLASVLWQCGLLGYESEATGTAVFFSLDRLGRMRIPPDREEYVLHSSMHEVARVRIGDRPVTPWGP